MTSNSWPSATVYVAAVQDPERCVIAEELKGAEFRSNMMGIPVVKSGQTAAVFPMTLNGQPQALRLFTTPTQHAERYRQLSSHLERQPSELFVGAKWIEEAIAYGQGRFPAVLMPWVPGKTLSSALDDATEDRDVERIGALAEGWLNACDQLAVSGVVHGDIQHGNVMVDEDGTFALIDYDGVWVEGLPVSMLEVGHPNYQHPARLESDEVSLTADVFPAFVTYVSLKALAAEPKLWDEFHSGENLIFSSEDFVGVDRAERTIWSRLRDVDDEVATLATTLIAACRVKPDSIDSVRALVEEGVGALEGAEKYIVDRSGRATGGSWWADDDGEPSTPQPSPVASGPASIPGPRPQQATRRQPIQRPVSVPEVQPPSAVRSSDPKLRALAIVSFLVGLIVMGVAIFLLVSGG
ncbi:MAG: hypothetical protein R2754_17740 [Microthrixaceae bacterium]